MKIWKTAAYIRLSREDGDKPESDSVQNQRAILTAFIDRQPDLELYDLYIDDGISGTTFNRPGFRRMMADIYAGKVTAVVVKDLSRFARNSAASEYLDSVFPQFDVRFISLNNEIDSVKKHMNAATQCISVGVTNVLNESVAATTSVNVRATLDLHRKQGKFIGSFAPYGYRKDPDDHNHLTVDEDAAQVVRRIYDEFLSGNSIAGIAKNLNHIGIPNPSQYKKLNGIPCNRRANEDGLWTDRTIRRMLTAQVYIGTLEQGKSTTVSYKNKKQRSIPKEDWIVAQDTHEPIISREQFDKAQALLDRNTRTSPNDGQVGLFAGLVYCADCKRALCKNTKKLPYGEYTYLKCSTHKKMKSSACSPHTVRLDKLEEAVLATLQMLVDVAVDLDETMAAMETKTKQMSTTSPLQKALIAQQKELAKWERVQHSLYPDYVSGLLSKTEFETQRQQVCDQQNAIRDNIAKLKQSIMDEKTAQDDRIFLQRFKQYRHIDRLTRPLLLELIHRIDVCEGGRITIRFKCQDVFLRALSRAEKGCVA